MIYFDHMIVYSHISLKWLTSIIVGLKDLTVQFF